MQDAVNRYDVAIIGSGPGGYVAALRAAQLGLKVACIEKQPRLGGTCLNVGCIPSKALLEASHHWAHLQELGNWGITTQGSSFDFKKMMERKDRVVLSFHQGISALFKRGKIDQFQAEASFQGPHELLLKREDGSTTILQANSFIMSPKSPRPSRAPTSSISRPIPTARARRSPGMCRRC